MDEIGGKKECLFSRAFLFLPSYLSHLSNPIVTERDDKNELFINVI